MVVCEAPPRRSTLSLTLTNRRHRSSRDFILTPPTCRCAAAGRSPRVPAGAIEAPWVRTIYAHTRIYTHPTSYITRKAAASARLVSRVQLEYTHARVSGREAAYASLYRHRDRCDRECKLQLACISHFVFNNANGIRKKMHRSSSSSSSRRSQESSRPTAVTISSKCTGTERGWRRWSRDDTSDLKFPEKSVSSRYGDGSGGDAADNIDKIVFPTDDVVSVNQPQSQQQQQQQQSPSKFVPRLAGNCEKSTFCEFAPNYPKDFVETNLRINSNKFLPSEDVVMNENAECNLIEGFVEGYKTVCKQKYIYRQLVAVLPAASQGHPLDVRSSSVYTREKRPIRAPSSGGACVSFRKSWELSMGRHRGYTE
ncbi:unnamed protein product [Trichogramma brassicae]|uniref:Spaetzle domain-containing protein n=1 Tax=Trichogramma brassicae TaxID=86971 RepID=A0A6H5J615_9HYME|nr:unnamed protein product [Trichogramma brassicae]